MPRRRRRPDVLRGLSGRFTADLDRLERTRSYLYPGSVRRALEAWAGWQRSPARNRWLQQTWEWGHEPDEDPFHAREVLDAVARALPRTSARELRRRLRELDQI